MLTFRHIHIEDRKVWDNEKLNTHAESHLHRRAREYWQPHLLSSGRGSQERQDQEFQRLPLGLHVHLGRKREDQDSRSQRSKREKEEETKVPWPGHPQGRETGESGDWGEEGESLLQEDWLIAGLTNSLRSLLEADARIWRNGGLAKSLRSFLHAGFLSKNVDREMEETESKERGEIWFIIVSEKGDNCCEGRQQQILNLPCL